MVVCSFVISTSQLVDFDDLVYLNKNRHGH